MLKLSFLEKRLLNDAGWSIEGNMLISLNTGCKISGEFVEGFAKDKIEELREEQGISTKEDISDEEILKMEGIEIICESPFELEDRDGNMITGECALWLRTELVTTYHKHLG